MQSATSDPTVGSRTLVRRWADRIGRAATFGVGLIILLNPPDVARPRLVLWWLLVAMVVCFGVHRPRRQSLPLAFSMAVGLVGSGWALLLAGGPEHNSFSQLCQKAAIGLTIVSVGRTQQRTSRDGATRRRPAGAPVLQSLVDGLYAGALVTLLIGIGETITGHKIAPWLVPGTNIAEMTTLYRPLVTAFYGNYNDYSLVVAMLVVLVCARMLLAAGPATASGRIRGAARLFIGLLGTAEVVVIGSRGALVALLLGVALVTITSMRLLRPSLIGARGVLLGLVLAGAGAVGFSSSGYVQDHSTAVRGRIVERSLQLIWENPRYLAHGWVDSEAVRTMAYERFGPALYDPHNVVLEVLEMYGLPTLGCIAVLWLWLVYRGLGQLRIFGGWREVGLVSLVALLPLIGGVPSSTLQYHWSVVLVSGAVLALQLRSEARSMPQLVSDPAPRMLPVSNSEPPPRPVLYADDRALDLFGYLASLRRFWVISTAVGLVVLLAGGVFAFTRPVVFTASATVALVPPAVKTPAEAAQQAKLLPALKASYSQLVSSRPVVEPVADRLSRDTGRSVDVDTLRAAIAGQWPSDSLLGTITIRDTDENFAIEAVRLLAAELGRHLPEAAEGESPAIQMPVRTVSVDPPPLTRTSDRNELLLMSLGAALAMALLTAVLADYVGPRQASSARPDAASATTPQTQSTAQTQSTPQTEDDR